MTREPLTHVRILIYRTWAIRNVEKTVLLKFFAGSKFLKKKWPLDGEAQRAFVTIFGSLYVSGKLLTYPSPKPTFCPK